MAKFKKKKSHRNAGGRKLFKAPTGWLGSSVATVLGGGGGAVIGGVLARQEIVKPETTGLLMTVGGLIGGVFAEGHTRTAMQGMAGAGAGQLALSYMEKQEIAAAVEAAKAAQPAPVAQPQVAATATPALPAAAPNGQAGPVSTPSNAYGSGGSVWSAFRDAAGELEWLDDDDANAEGWEGYDD